VEETESGVILSAAKDLSYLCDASRIWEVRRIRSG